MGVEQGGYVPSEAEDQLANDRSEKVDDERSYFELKEGRLEDSYAKAQKILRDPNIVPPYMAKELLAGMTPEARAKFIREGQAEQARTIIETEGSRYPEYTELPKTSETVYGWLASAKIAEKRGFYSAAEATRRAASVLFRGNTEVKKYSQENWERRKNALEEGNFSLL